MTTATRSLLACLLVAGASAVGAPASLAAPRLPWAPHGAHEASRPLPFTAGEELVYQVRLGRIGRGQATMRVGQEEVRGRPAWLLSFDVRARVALAVVEDRSRSWVDPERMAALRYHKHERTPLGAHEEKVEIFPGERRWTAASGAGGATACDAPLDELSFIYYIRALPFREVGEQTVGHHFDPARNPVRVRLVGRERVTVPAGEFSTLVVEMTVVDERRYGGEGVIRFHLTDDEHRVPVRIQTSMPVAGSTVMSLERWVPGSKPGA